MKTTLMSALIGAAMIFPADADAQRGRGRGHDRGPRVEQRAPVTTSGRVLSGRLASCRAPRGARPFNCASRVVYSSHAGYASSRVWRPYRDARVRVRFSWGAPIRFRGQRHFGRALNQAELRRFLGHQTLNEIRRAGRDMGLRGPVRGRWIETRRQGMVLVVTMQRVEIAEFLDYDRDGLIDDGFFIHHDRGRRWAAYP